MPKIDAEFTIIGLGIAGITAALIAQEALKRIVVLEKGRPFYSGSTFCNRNHRWGITYARDREEKELLARRINDISRGTNNPELTRIVVEYSYDAFLTLKKWGVLFLGDAGNRTKRLAPCFMKAPMASVIRDTGQLREALLRRLDPSVTRVLEGHRATGLVISRGQLLGITATHGSERVDIHTRMALLASGGRAARITPNVVEPGLTGDGYGLLSQAGLKLKNMAYVQEIWEDIDPGAPRFRPSCLWDGRHIFLNSKGVQIQLPPADSDIVKERRMHVPISNLQEDRAYDELLLEHVHERTEEFAITVCDRASRVPLHSILPHAQACNGGIEIGPKGETGIQGLFAAGEVTTGMHGGDRVGGMMITSAVVFGKRAANEAVRLLST